MKNLVLYIVAGVVALAVVVGTATLVARAVAGNAPGVNNTGGTEGQGNADMAKGKTVALKPFVTNLADTDRPRYINITFELVLPDEEAVTAIQAYIPSIRDTILVILNSKKSLEVSGLEGANKLKSEVLTKVNDSVPGKKVMQVLITDSVVQF